MTAAFYGCTGLTSINVDPGNPSYSSQDGVLYNQGETRFIMYPPGKSGSFTIPDGVTSIGAEAFYNCTGLTSVTIPASVRRMYGSQRQCGMSCYAYNAGSFLDCALLTSAFFLGNAPQIVYYDCCPYPWASDRKSPFCNSASGFTVYYLAGATGFTNPWNGDPTAVFTPTSTSTTTTVISYGKLTYSARNNRVTIIGYTGAGGSVVIPDTIDGMPVVSIGYQAFFNKSGLTGVTIPGSVTSIEDMAFQGCGLTSLTIPDSVTSIGWYAFAGCAGLTSVSIPGSVTSLGISSFQSCSGLTTVIIMNGVQSIGDRAFTLCSGLASVSIPGSVTSIGASAFQDCTALTRINIPASVTNIWASAFQGCTALAAAYFYGNAPEVPWSDIFLHCASNFTVYYLAGAAGFASPSWCPTFITCYPSRCLPSGTTTTTILTTTTTSTASPTTTTVPVDIDNDGDGKFDYIQAGCSNQDGDCDYNDAAADGNQIAMMNNDGTSTLLKTYADIGFNAVTPAFHPVRTETRNYCTNLSWGGIDTWQPLDEQDIWKARICKSSL